MRPDRGGPPVAVDGPGQLVVDNRQLPGAASDEEAEQAHDEGGGDQREP